MKEIILLEQWILSKPATNAEHQQAIAWLMAIQRQLAEKNEDSK